VDESNAYAEASPGFESGGPPLGLHLPSCTAKESNLAARPYQNRLRTHAAVRTDVVRDLRIELSFTGL
jgi:hypothetical protein